MKNTTQEDDEMTILELKNIEYTYGRGTPFEKKALNDVSLTIEKGTVTGIIGHTGSGKSTLVQIMVGLLKSDSGSLIFDNEDVWKDPKKPQGAKFNIGLVMQYPEYQLFDETVRLDIAYAPKNMGLNDISIDQRVSEAALYTGLHDDILDRSPFELSGGQKRRVAIAGVLAMRPKVLVLDEPAAGLDPKGRAEILGGLRSYCDKIGASIVIVSHSMEDIARYCDNIIVMNNGCVVMQGKSEDVFSHGEELETYGLKIPSITRICKKLQEHGFPISKTVLTVEQASDVIWACLKESMEGNNA